MVGLLLVAASAVHNFIGYVLGYWGSRAAGLSIQDSRTLSIEVALKNGGLGMGLALDAKYLEHTKQEDMDKALRGEFDNSVDSGCKKKRMVLLNKKYVNCTKKIRCCQGN